MATRYRSIEDIDNDNRVSFREASIAIKENDKTGELDNPSFFLKRGLTEDEYRDLAISSIKNYSGELSTEEYIKKLIKYTDYDNGAQLTYSNFKREGNLEKLPNKLIDKQKIEVSSKDLSSFNGIKTQEDLIKAINKQSNSAPKKQTFKEAFRDAYDRKKEKFEWVDKNGKVTVIAVKLASDKSEDSKKSDESSTKKAEKQVEYRNPTQDEIDAGYRKILEKRNIKPAEKGVEKITEQERIDNAY